MCPRVYFSHLFPPRPSATITEGPSARLPLPERPPACGSLTATCSAGQRMSPLASGSFLEVPSSPRPPCLSGSRWGCLSLLTVNVGQSFSSPRARSPPTRKLEQNSISHSETPGKQPARLWGDRPPEGRLAGSAVQSPRTSSAAPHNAKPRPRPAVPCLGVPVPGKLRSGARGGPHAPPRTACPDGRNTPSGRPRTDHAQNGVRHAMLTQPPADPRVGWERSRPLPPTPRPRRGRLAAP